MKKIVVLLFSLCLFLVIGAACTSNGTEEIEKQNALLKDEIQTILDTHVFPENDKNYTLEVSGANKIVITIQDLKIGKSDYTDSVIEEITKYNGMEIYTGIFTAYYDRIKYYIDEVETVEDPQNIDIIIRDKYNGKVRLILENGKITENIFEK